MRRSTVSVLSGNAMSPGRSAPGEKVTLPRTKFRGLRPVALLVLLPRAAPAGIVAPDLLCGLDPPLLDDRHGLGRLGALGALEADLLGRARRGHGHGRLRVEPAGGVGHVAAAGRGPRAPPRAGRGDVPRRLAVFGRELDLDVEDHPGEVGPD